MLIHGSQPAPHPFCMTCNSQTARPMSFWTSPKVIKIKCNSFSVLFSCMTGFLLSGLNDCWTACWCEIQTKCHSTKKCSFFVLLWSSSSQAVILKLKSIVIGLEGWFWMLRGTRTDSMPSPPVLASQASQPRQSRSSSPQTAPEKTTMRASLQGTSG